MTLRHLQLPGSLIDKWGPAIRALAAQEVGLFRRHLIRLSRGCRRSRFGNETTDAFLRDYGARVNAMNTVVLGLFRGERSPRCR
jgi:hypothetical protein